MVISKLYRGNDQIVVVEKFFFIILDVVSLEFKFGYKVAADLSCIHAKFEVRI